MSEQVPGADTSEPDTSEPDTLQCPWCSAILASPDEERCPSCNAGLHEVAADEVPGVTSIDHRALLDRKLQPRTSGFLGWLTGSYQEQVEVPAPSAAAPFGPPDDDVKREMVRMEIAAIEASLEADRALLETERGIAGGEVGPDTDPDTDPGTDPDTDRDSDPDTDRDTDPSETRVGSEGTTSDGPVPPT